MLDINSSDSDRDIGNKRNVDWWYHYISRGLGKDEGKYVNNDFMLASCKYTPDFANYEYHPRICHYQIGQTANVGSTVVMATSVGNKKTEKYITGCYKVKKVGSWIPIKVGKTRAVLCMNKDDSLLLLDNPIKIDVNLAKRLFPNKRKNYWEEKDETLAQKIGSTLRNCHLTPNQKDIIITELKKRFDEGSKNYLGKNYQRLLERIDGG